MKTILSCIFALLLFGGCLEVNGQAKADGPIIKGYGEVFKIDEIDFKTNLAQDFKVVFDIMASPDGHESLNLNIETAARFLNMHAQAGIPLVQLKVALVVHNAASKDIIDNEAYNKRYGVDNPNHDLVKALLEAGAEVILCGQSSAARGFPKKDLIDGVQISLSAMTALIQLQKEDYYLIKF